MLQEPEVINWLDERVQKRLLSESPVYARQVYARAHDLDESGLSLYFGAQEPWWLWR
jgi:hypothetical protein